MSDGLLDPPFDVLESSDMTVSCFHMIVHVPGFVTSSSQHQPADEGCAIRPKCPSKKFFVLCLGLITIGMNLK